MLLCAVVLLTTATSCACAVRPGFKARITQHALDYGRSGITDTGLEPSGDADSGAANQQAIDAVATLVSKASIPDQSGSSGGVDYSLTNIHITGFTKPSSSIKLVPSVGLSWSAANAGISLHADWRVKYKKGWFKVSTSGSVDVSARGVSFSLTMALGDDSTGRPSIKSGGCSCSVDGVDIDIHGDIAFFLNLFKREIEKRVRALIPGKLCDAVNEEVNNKAESQLKKLKVVTSLLDKKFMLDYRLVSVPAFQSAYMETFHKGEITWQANPQAPPFAPQPLPPYPSSSSMLYLWVGQYVPQSFIYAAQHHGFLQYNLTTKDLPPDQRGFLNTTCTSLTCVGNLVPAIGKKYPGCTVELRMNSTAMPQVKMAPGQLEAWFAGDIAFFAHTQQGETPYLLTLNVSAMFNMTATIANQLIVGNISGSSFKVDVVKSAVGPLKSKAINTMVGLTLKFFVIPKLNEKGNSGFPLPVSDDVKFVNTQLQIQQDALMIGTDLEYQFH